jgi:hypothetical protein
MSLKLKVLEEITQELKFHLEEMETKKREFEVEMTKMMEEIDESVVETFTRALAHSVVSTGGDGSFYSSTKMDTLHRLAAGHCTHANPLIKVDEFHH